MGASFAGSPQPSLGGIGATKDGILGSASSPIHMVTSEGGFKQQFWRTVRTLGLAFLMVSAIGALFEDRGIGKGWIFFLGIKCGFVEIKNSQPVAYRGRVLTSRLTSYLRLVFICELIF